MIFVPVFFQILWPWPEQSEHVLNSEKWEVSISIDVCRVANWAF